MTISGRSGRTRALLLVRLSALPLVAAVMLSATSSYLVRTATALVAAGVLLASARGGADGLRRSRQLFAAALLVGAASGLSSAGHLLVTGEEAQVGWLSDWLYLSYGPLAVAGVLAVPRQAKAPGGIVRALADGAVAAGSLWYLAMVLLIDPRDLGADLDPMAQVATLAFPLMPAFVVAVFLSALPRVGPGARPFLLRAAASLALLGLGDAAFAVAAWGGWYDPASWIAGVNQLGLLLMVEVALVGATATTDRATEGTAEMDATHGWLVVGTPFAPLALAILVALREMLAGHQIPPSQVAPILAIGTAVVVRHIASARETGRLVARLAARERLARRAARTDPLTRLSNRTEFVRLLDAALREPAAYPVAVALLDLNDFKDINDTHGHDTGDEVLMNAARRLRAAVPGGAVARLGGDEFAAFRPSSADGGQALGDGIAAAFGSPVQIGTRSFSVRPSVGVVVDERPIGAARAGDAGHLLAHADVAMYQAKSSKGVQAIPVAVLTGAARARATATIRIRDEVSAPDLAQFRVEYQPVVDLRTGEIVGAEALLRWRHPELGEISPATFIPLAERVGSVAVLGTFVLATALDDLARWTTAYGRDLTLGINFSPLQLTDPALPGDVLRQIADRGLAPDQLIVEITEEAFVEDIEAVVEAIAALRAAGVSVAVDDFGTGYSSLRYLRRFDANLVKIDREFVQASSSEPRTDALVRSVVAMAAALDLVCVAEGIETLEQLARVRAHGCQLGQGFLLARPMPAPALAELLAARHVYPVDVHAPDVAAPAADVVPLRGLG